MKFAIDIGHNAPPKDTGAVGIKREDNLCKEVGEKLISNLEKAGHLVVRTAPMRGITVNDSLKHRCQVANLSNADLFVSIHFNAANYRAYGSEVYALSAAGAAIGSAILSQISRLGFFNRGVKRANFYVLRHTTMPAVLVECCFCDSQKDMAMFKADSMARAIALGLIGDLPSLPNELRTLTIKENTWLKQTTEQALDLKPEQKTWLKQGKYQVLAATPQEEGHYFVKLLNKTEGFVFAGHSQVS